MIKYTIKRLFQSLITVLLVVSAVFLLLRLLPTDYFFTEDQLIKLDEHEQEDMLRINGYLDHPFVQLGRFYQNLVKTEHQPHYFDRINMIDASTVEISFLEEDAAANLTAQNITLQCMDDRPQIKSKSVAADAETANVLKVTTKDPIEMGVPYSISLKESLITKVEKAEVSADPAKPNTLVITTDAEIENGVDYDVTVEEYPVLNAAEVSVVTIALRERQNPDGSLYVIEQSESDEPMRTNSVNVKLDRAVERGTTYTFTCEGYTGSFKASGFGSALKLTTEDGKDYFESVTVKDATNIVIAFKAEGAAEAVKAETVSFTATTPLEYKGAFEFWGDELTERIEADGKRFFGNIVKIDEKTYELGFVVTGAASYVNVESFAFKAKTPVEHVGNFTFTADAQTGEVQAITSDEEEAFFGSITMVDEKNFEIELLKDGVADDVTTSQLTFRSTLSYPVINVQESAVVAGPDGRNVLQLKLDGEIEKKSDYQLVCDKHIGTFELKKEGWERAAKINGEETNDMWDYLSHMKIWLDFGKSHRVQTGKPVVEIIGGKMVTSLSIGLAALVIALLVGVPLGILQARYKDGIFDGVGQGYTIFINAVPHLVTYFLIMIIGSRLFGLPISYSTQDPLMSSILPVIALSMGSIASYMLWMRRYMVDELNKDYIRLAKLKGMSTTQVMFRHVMKNAFLPLAQYLPYSVLLTVGGSILVEKMFGVPGLGGLLPDAIAKYDTNLVQAVVSLYATLGILGLFLGDVLMIVLDPRIRLTEKGGTR